nr:hypothetical protein Iba_chr10aCG3200 [Ipomoea batatas]
MIKRRVALRGAAKHNSNDECSSDKGNPDFRHCWAVQFLAFLARLTRTSKQVTMAKSNSFAIVCLFFTGALVLCNCGSQSAAAALAPVAEAPRAASLRFFTCYCPNCTICVPYCADCDTYGCCPWEYRTTNAN